jgi:hypothetical protein
MRFESKEGTEVQFSIVEESTTPLLEMIRPIKGGYDWVKCKMAYVHPESLHLLEPKVGDIIRLYFYSPAEDDAAGAVMTGIYAGGREAVTWFRSPRDGSIEKELHKIDEHTWQIMQRDGKPFFWPDSDAA